jgi:hypothetical protein
MVESAVVESIVVESIMVESVMVESVVENVIYACELKMSQKKMKCLEEDAASLFLKMLRAWLRLLKKEGMIVHLM